MGKTYKDKRWKDAFEKVRIPIPRPGHAMPTDKMYKRKRDKKVCPEEDNE